MTKVNLEPPTVDHKKSGEEDTIHVLHVDDEAGFLKAAKQILEMQGNFEVETAASVEEAQEKMREKEFDVIVSDYIMPGKDGLEFLKELRDSSNNIPFIIFTGKGREIVAIKALNLGADQYINKIGKPEAVYGELAHGIRHVVERKRANLEVWKREQKLRAILASSPDIITASDLQGNIVDCNEAAWKLMGFSSKEELLGKSSFDFIAEKDRKRALENLKKTLEQEAVRNVEYTLIRKDGEEYTGLLSASILKDSSGNLIGFVGVVRDITERKKAEEVLRDANEKWVSLMENTDDVIMILDGKGTIQYLNSTPLATDPREAIGKSVYEYVPREQHDIMRESLRKVFKTGKPDSYEVSPNIQGIGTIWFSTKVVPVKHDKKTTSLILISADITERKKAEEEIRSLAKFPGENPNPVLRVAKDGTGLFANAAAKRILKKEKSGFGKLVPVRGRQWVSDVLKSGLSKEVEIEYEDKIFSFLFAPVVGSDYVNVYGRDVTGRKKAEKALNGVFDELSLVNEKLNVVGRFTRHDVRNKLSAVTGNIYLARQALPPDHETVKYLEATESAVDQIERIFDFARTYEQLGTEELSYVDVGKSFGVAVSLLPDLGGIEVVNDCKGLSVLADSLLGQLFYNLMHNSIRHGEKVSRIRIYHKVGKDDLKLVYEDNGVGIPEDEKEKIFGEGYGKGTGIGLHMMKIICKVYGWAIRETGKQGKGAQFTMTIPKTNKSGKTAYNFIKP